MPQRIAAEKCCKELSWKIAAENFCKELPQKKCRGKVQSTFPDRKVFHKGRGIGAKHTGPRPFLQLLQQTNRFQTAPAEEEKEVKTARAGAQRPLPPNFAPQNTPAKTPGRRAARKKRRQALGTQFSTAAAMASPSSQTVWGSTRLSYSDGFTMKPSSSSTAGQVVVRVT